MSDDKQTTELLKKRIRELAPVLAEHRQALERDRRLPSALFEAIAAAGLLRLWAPRRFNGWELSFADFMEIVEAASALDGSVGWIVGNGGGMSRAGGYVPEAVARDWFANPNAFIVATNGALGAANPVAGGYRISGRWPFASGIHHASLVAPACRITGGVREGQVLLAYLPAEQATVLDTWHVAGLRGTGSCDYTLDDVYVPESHTHEMLNPPATQPGPVYRLPAVSAFAATVSVVPLGIARAALDAFGAGMASRARAGTAVALRDRELIQSEIGRAETLHAAGRELLICTMRDLLAATDVGGERLVRARAMFRVACSHAAECAMRIADIVSSAAGAASIWEEHPLERQARDIRAASQHVAMSPNNYVVAGRICLGLDPGVARF